MKYSPLSRQKSVFYSVEIQRHACRLPLGENSGLLNDPSQLPPFSLPWKLLTLHGEAKFFSFSLSNSQLSHANKNKVVAD